MKKVCLIEPVPDCLKTVKSYLSDINANYSVFQNFGDMSKSGVKPDLLIVFASREHAGIIANMPDLPAVPSILINADDFRLDEKSRYRPRFILRFPVTKQSFLTKAAICLGIPPRRFFSIIVTVTEEGSNIRYSGVSKDFSETGMSLEALADFPPNQALSVRFIDVRNRKKFSLNAEVARKTEIGKGMFFYGLKFKDLTQDDADSLKVFISASDVRQTFSPGG
ncbi:MAG: PilZ domain-containing protein [Candidatus Sulfobium sp.]